MGKVKAFHFVVDCSLTIDQPVYFGDELANAEEVEAQVQQALAASCEMAREEPYVPF